MVGHTSSPRIAFVVPQYGADLGGGLEKLCQLVAERMQGWWDIEVLTTCSRDFATWANSYPPGVEPVGNVPVRRFPVERERDPEPFRRLSDLVLQGTPTREQEEQWIRAQGPDSPALFDHITSHLADFDLFVFFGYLYSTTSLGILRAQGKSVLVPAAHDEPMIRLSVYRDVFRSAGYILYSTPEERRLVESVLGERTRGEICGVGFETPVLAPESAVAVPEPYLIYVGRVDHPKGCGELISFFSHRPPDLSRLNLCLVGHKRMEIPPLEGIYWLGYQREDQKNRLVSKALSLVMPSPYESLSLVLLEGWSCGVPVLVNGRCSVLKGQCERSGGGLSYTDEQSFFEAVRTLYHSPTLRSLFSTRGRRYARQMYSWDRIEGVYWKALEEVTGEKGRTAERRPGSTAGSAPGSAPGSAGILPALGPQASCLPAPPPQSLLPTEQAGKMPAAPVQAGCLRSQGRSQQASPKKLAFVIPWYGRNIPGGAETLCREWAERLAGVGYEVEVLTTTIREFQSNWNEAHHRAGEYREGGVLVRRFDLRRGDHHQFNEANSKLLAGAQISTEEEMAFLTEGPNSDALTEYVREHRDEYCFFFIPYLFGTTYWGARAAGERALLIPCLHDEAYARLPRIRQLFSEASGLIFNSHSEQMLARRLFPLSDTIKTIVLGMGLDPEIECEPEAFRWKFRQTRPFILCAGRKDATKNSDLLVGYFKLYKRFNPRSDLQLVFIGQGELATTDEDIRDLGFISVQDKWNAYGAARLLCNPSVNESFSIVVMESWLCGTPVTVHASCDVTRDHVEQSGGGIYFSDYYEWEAGVKYLLERPELGARMAAAGAAFVRANCSWEVLLARFSKWLAAVLDSKEAGRQT